MSRPQPIDWRVIKAGLVRWIEDVSGGLIVVWGNQSAPQPAYPYASITTLPGQPDLGVLDDEQWLSDGGLQIVGQMEFGLSVQIHVGPPDNVNPDCDAESIAYAVVASLATPATKAEFASVGLGLRNRTNPQRIDALVGAEWISRHLIEFRFGLASVLNPTTAPGLDAIGYFDKIRLSSTIDGLENPGGPLDLNDELFDPNAP